MKTLKLIARARRLKLRPVAGVRFRWSWLGGALLVPALCGQVAMAAPRIPVAPVIVWSEDFENPQTPPITTEGRDRSEEHTSELQSPDHLLCPLLLEKKKKKT